MALISCPECTKQVSNTAATCPHCGAPIAEVSTNKAAGVALVTVQETSKKLKLQIIFASIVFWVGVVWLFSGFNTRQNGAEPSGIAGMAMNIGLIWYVVTKFRIWWNHK